MAVDIDNVYQKVLALANKEQRGYITPQEFNLFADKAQNEIFNNYFHKIKITANKPKTQTLYSDELEMLEEKLHYRNFYLYIIHIEIIYFTNMNQLK